MFKFKGKHLKTNPLLPQVISVALISIIILSICISVFAHPGNTDSQGGHYNRKTGEYHYHTGEYAGRDSSSMPWYITYGIFVILVFLIGGIYAIWIWVSNSLPNTIIFNLEQALYNCNNAKQRAISCDKTLKETKEKAIIPDGYEIGKDGLPKEINAANINDDDIITFALTDRIKNININWGESLTVYTVHDGWKLHLNRECCGSSFVYRKNIYSFYNKRYSLCKKCAENYQVPNMEWYVEYLKLSPQIKASENAKHEYSNALNRLNSCYSDCNSKLLKFLLFFSPSKKKKINELKREYSKLVRLSRN